MEVVPLTPNVTTGQKPGGGPSRSRLPLPVKYVPQPALPSSQLVYCHEDGHGSETHDAHDDNVSPGLIFPYLGGYRRGRRGGSRPYYGGRVSRGGGGGLGGYGPQVTKRDEEEGVGDDGPRRHRPASRPRAEGIGGNEMGHLRAKSPRALRRRQHSRSVVC